MSVPASIPVSRAPSLSEVLAEKLDDVVPTIPTDDAVLSDLQRKAELLTKEITMLNSYLLRLDPSSTKETHAGQRRLESKEGMPFLSMEQKCDVARLETEGVREAMGRVRNELQESVDRLKGELENCESRTKELRTEALTFQRTIVEGARHPITGTVASEKLVRHFDDLLRSKDATNHKLTMRNQQLRRQIRKVEAQIRQREDKGEAILAIDFEQLKIENEQGAAKIAEKNKELLELKLSVSRANQTLGVMKKRLTDAEGESEWLGQEIDARTVALEKIQQDKESIMEERDVALRLNRRLKVQQEENKMPQVMRYIGLKAETDELAKNIKMWSRKVEVAQLTCRGRPRD